MPRHAEERLRRFDAKMPHADATPLLRAMLMPRVTPQERYINI